MSSQMDDDHYRRIRPSLDAFRLRWIVKDIPMEAPIDKTDPTGNKAIEIIADAFDPTSLKLPYKSENGVLHPIHACSVSIIPRKELTVTIPALYNYILYDECPEDHSDFDEEAGVIPYDEPKCEVKAIANGQFITIGDYIEAVYPWLISLRERYLDQAPVPGDAFSENVELWVDPSNMLRGLQLHEYEPPSDSDLEDTEGSDEFKGVVSMMDFWQGTADIAEAIKSSWPELEQTNFT